MSSKFITTTLEVKKVFIRVSKHEHNEKYILYVI